MFLKYSMLLSECVSHIMPNFENVPQNSYLGLGI